MKTIEELNLKNKLLGQLYSAHNNRQNIDPDSYHLLYNRSLSDLNELFLNGMLEDTEELEYLRLRQEALDLQIREATSWKE